MVGAAGVFDEWLNPRAKPALADLPANAVGGSINIVSKTGFSASRPSLKYNFYLTDNALEGLSHYRPTFNKVAGQNDIVTQRRVQPSYSLYYSNPINEKVAITLGELEKGWLDPRVTKRTQTER